MLSRETNENHIKTICVNIVCIRTYIVYVNIVSLILTVYHKYHISSITCALGSSSILPFGLVLGILRPGHHCPSYQSQRLAEPCAGEELGRVAVLKRCQELKVENRESEKFHLSM